VGCFNPRYGGSSFYCHAGDQPACPDGQYCIGGRCVDPSTISDDGGVSPIADLGRSAPPDFASPANPNPSPTPTHTPTPTPTPTPSPTPGATMTGCNGYVLCLSMCADPTCQSSCDANVTQQGMQLEQQAVDCGQMWCVSTGDCVPDATGTMLTDGPNGAGSCNACINDALADLFGTQCSSPTSTNCNPVSCASADSACFADLP
jgi:hypothetical protein